MYKYELEKIKNSIERVSAFNIEYYKLFYSAYFKNKNQKVNIRIDEKDFIKLFKNNQVICEEREYKLLNKEISCCELIKIYDKDIVFTTYIYNAKYDKGIKKIKKFSKLKILKEE